MLLKLFAAFNILTAHAYLSPIFNKLTKNVASVTWIILFARTNERTISMILNRTYMTYGFAWKFVAIETTDCALVLLPTHHNKPSDILCREVTKNTKYSHVEHVFWLKSPLKFRAIEEFLLRFGVDKRRWVQLIEDCLWKRRATQESNASKKICEISYKRK